MYTSILYDKNTFFSQLRTLETNIQPVFWNTDNILVEMNLYYKYSDHTGDDGIVYPESLYRCSQPLDKFCGYDMKNNFTWNLLEGRMGCWNTLQYKLSITCLAMNDDSLAVLVLHTHIGISKRFMLIFFYLAVQFSRWKIFLLVVLN